MTTSTLPTQPTTGSTPLVIPGTRAAVWIFGTTLLCLAVYYFIGVDQGATSVFGNDMHIHEFVHDARHFLGFPCH
jgi:putative cobalt transporter subunit CbtB